MPALAVDWQSIALTVIAVLCSIVWWEIRRLRKAKHRDAQILQWVLIVIGIIARKVDVELPPMVTEEE